MPPVALTIAGSDPSGGAGLQADLKTFHQHGVYGTSVTTLLTVQNTVTVDHVEILDPGLASRQLMAVLSDIPPAAAKTGALGNAAMIREVAEHASEFAFPLVVDPVMISKHGVSLMDEDAIQELVNRLLPLAHLVTPNLAEAARLTQTVVDSLDSMKQAALAIAGMGPSHVLVKGGHLEGEATDVLYHGGEFSLFTQPRIATDQTHGTGCVTSAAITAWLARGADIVSAVQRAKSFVFRAIETNPGLGHGYGPVNLFVPADSP